MTGAAPSRRKLLVGASILAGAAVLAAVAYLALFRAPAPGSDPSPFVPLPVEARLLFVGIDGLDGDLVESLAESGSVDVLLETMADGSVWPVRPRGAIERRDAWTTIATGMEPPARGARTLWEIVGLFRPVAIAGWPGEPGPEDPLAAARHLLDDPALSAAFVHLPGLDLLRRRGASQPEIEAHLRELDAFVRDLAGRGTVVLVADPGRSGAPSAEGFVVVLGGGAERRCIGEPIGLPDIAPLVLRLEGFPASREMPGALPRRCLGGLAELPRIATYGRRKPGTVTIIQRSS